MSKPALKPSGDVPDELVPDPTVFQEFHITSMTGWRWDRDPELVALGWPPPVKIRNRNFRSRRLVEAFKEALVRQALEQRVRSTA
jgi:hypothetical protein